MFKATLHKTTAAVMVLAVMAAAVSCKHLDDDRIPVLPVNILFPTIAEWNVYGVAGAMEYKTFILEDRIPRNFPYTAISATGYGGVLLVSDVLGEPKAFDLSCPVEAKREIRIAIDTEKMVARCPKCGSEYDVFSLLGHPLSGPAAQHGYGLRRYYVGSGRDGSYRQIGY